jgi:hypothetical protein
MGYLDGLIESVFQKREDNKSVFYPNGLLGHGYCLTKDAEANLKQFLNRYLKIMFPIIIFSLLILGVYTVFTVIIMLSVYYIKIYKILSKAEKVRKRLNYKKSVRSMAKVFGTPICVLMLCFSLILTLVSAPMIFSEEDRYLGIFGFIIFGGASVYSTILFKFSMKL